VYDRRQRLDHRVERPCVAAQEAADQLGLLAAIVLAKDMWQALVLGRQPV